MSVRTAIWKVGTSPVALSESTLANEKLLEDMIVAMPRIVSDEWMLIGQQEATGLGGIIDLLAIALDGSLVLIELKRNRTPRDVVAQALDYASWVARLDAAEIVAIYSRFKPGRSLATDFLHHFKLELDEDTLNQSHQIVIVAGSLDDSTERIVGYLSDRGITINVLFFQVFSSGGEQLLSRSWLLDPVQVQMSAALVSASKPGGVWNGEFYCNFGHGANRTWDEAKKYSFLCAGGGTTYSRPLYRLKPGNRVWVYVPGRGYVGVARIIGLAQPASAFRVSTTTGDKPILEVVTEAKYHREEDEEHCEHFVPVKWLQTVSIETAVKELGFFSNQNNVCQPTTPTWATTVDRLKQMFPEYDKTVAETA